jgi:hypothetical protein
MQTTQAVPLDAHVPQTPLTVGDPLVVQLHAVLPAGATLVDRVARSRDTLPDGVRILSADTVQISNGVVVGQLRVAFFRPDSQVVPAFAIAYRTPAGTDTMVSAAIPLYVHPVLPTGNATLRDVRDVDRPLPVAALSLVVVAVVCAVFAMRLFRRASRATALVPVVTVEGPNAYDLAIEQLRAIDSALPVERRYALVADIIRGYIASAHGVPALERTTPEILTALGANGSLSKFLVEADRVKFAGLRPRAESAAEYTTRARGVLDALR